MTSATSIAPSRLIVSGDVGPYATWNVRICLSAENVAEGNRKLTDEDVAAIRASAESPTAIATRFGVSRPYVYELRSGKYRAA